jgi:Uma2 family endonuclease
MAQRRGQSRRDPLGIGRLGDRLLTIDDLDRLPDDGYRYELDEGVLVVSAAPSDYHQLVSSRLTAFLTYACPSDMLVIHARGVAISPIQFRIPDLVVIRADDLGAQPGKRPPLLAVEIASPSTERYDRSRKKQIYADFGVRDYWIITPDPEKPDITVFQLNGKEYKQADHVAGDATFKAKRPFPVAFAPEALVTTSPR